VLAVVPCLVAERRGGLKGRTDPDRNASMDEWALPVAMFSAADVWALDDLAKAAPAYGEQFAALGADLAGALRARRSPT
jgi:hypothetical protein